MKTLIILAIFFNMVSCTTCKPCEKDKEVVERIVEERDQFPICNNIIYDNKELTEESLNIFFPKRVIDISSLGSVVKKVKGEKKVFYLIDEDTFFDMQISEESVRLIVIQLLQERKKRCDMILEFNR